MRFLISFLFLICSQLAQAQLADKAPSTADAVAELNAQAEFAKGRIEKYSGYVADNKKKLEELGPKTDQNKDDVEMYQSMLKSSEQAVKNWEAEAKRIGDQLILKGGSI